MDDGTIAVVLMAVLLVVVVFGSLFGQDSRPEWKDVTRKPGFRMVGSMRRSDWPDDHY